ncbi:MAG TPA: TIGR02206 family membrane protein [Mycobacterium sp.]|nr:TIGR02206 family membrane protein [Mycobacterium sp.]
MTTYREFSAYGPSHWAVLAVFAVGAVLLVWLGRKQTEAEARRFGRVVGALTGAIYVGVFLYALFPPDLRWSVPLHMTDLATVATAYALWSQKHWAFALTYYWGLVLSVQALISPALTGPDFPHAQFLGFWAIHLIVVWAAIYLTWGRGMRPRWRSYRMVVAVSVSWGVLTFTFNSIAGTNYGFLNRKPATASLLDVLGPWPWYVLAAGVLVFAVWAMMTWPWERARRAHTGDDGPGGHGSSACSAAS